MGEPEPEGTLVSLFNFLPNTKSWKYAGICFGLAILFFLISLPMLSMLIIKPSKFTMSFSLSSIFLLSGLAFSKGLRVYIKRMFLRKNLFATICLITSLVMSLNFSLFYPSYLWCLFWCLVQLNSIVFFFFNTSPIGLN